MEEKVKKLQTLLIIALIVIGVLFLIIIANQSNKNSSNNSTNTEESSGYDISAFNSLNMTQLLDLFKEKKGTYVVYFGRPTCSACTKFTPTIQKMQEKYNFTTQYMDITGMDGKSDEFQELMNKFSKKVTLKVNGEEKTQEFGDFFGYTPMVFIIKDKKFVDGFVGSYTEANLEKFLNNNGIKKD